MESIFSNYEGIILVVGGLYGSLLAYEIVPAFTNDQDKNKKWLLKFGKTMKVLGPLLIVFGILSFLSLI